MWYATFIEIYNPPKQEKQDIAGMTPLMLVLKQKPINYSHRDLLSFWSLNNMSLTERVDYFVRNQPNEAQFYGQTVLHIAANTSKECLESLLRGQSVSEEDTYYRLVFIIALLMQSDKTTWDSHP